MNDPESGLYYNRRGEQVGTSEAIALMGATAASRVPGWLSMASRSPSRRVHSRGPVRTPGPPRLFPGLSGGCSGG